MKTVYFVRAVDNRPYMLVTVSEDGTDFQPLTGDADDVAQALSEAYDKVPVRRRQLDGALDDDLEIDGPFKESDDTELRIADFLEEANIPDYLPGTKPPKFTGKSDGGYSAVVTGLPLDAIDDDASFRNVVQYKALAFIADQTKTTFNYEVKRVRAVWDPSLSIPGTDRRGGWRCPVGTRYGGQITDRFGRNCGWGVARRIANAISNIGERLENIDDRRRGRGVARRNERMLRRLQRQAEPGRIERGLRGVAERLGGEDAPSAETLTPNTESLIPDAGTRQPGRIERGLRGIAERLAPDAEEVAPEADNIAPQQPYRAPVDRYIDAVNALGDRIYNRIQMRRQQRAMEEERRRGVGRAPRPRGANAGGRRPRVQPEPEPLRQEDIDQLRALGLAPNPGETFDAFVDRQYQNYRDQIDAANAGGGMNPRRALGREAWDRRNRDDLRALFDEVNGNEQFNPPARPADGGGRRRPWGVEGIEPDFLPERDGVSDIENFGNGVAIYKQDGKWGILIPSRNRRGDIEWFERRDFNDRDSAARELNRRLGETVAQIGGRESTARPRRRPGDLIEVEGDGGAIPLPQVNVGDEARPMPRVGEAEPDARVVRPSRRPRGPASRIIDGAAGGRRRPDAEQVNDADIAQIIQDFADAGVPLDELDLPDRPQDELLKEMMMGRLNNLYRQLYGPDGRINNLGRRLREERAAQGGGLQPGVDVPEGAPRRPRGRLGGDRERGEVLPDETFDQYVDRKYAEYEARIEEQRAGGGNPGKLTRSEWLAFNRGNLREAFDQRQAGRGQGAGEAAPAPRPARPRQPRNPRNRRAEASDGLARDTAARRPTERDVPAGTAPQPARQVTAAEVAETPEVPRSAPDSRSFRNIRNRFGTDGMPDEAYWRAPDYDGSDKDELERRFGQYYSRRTNRINSRGRAARAQVQQGEGRPRGGGRPRRRRAPAPQPEAAPAPAPARPATPAPQRPATPSARVATPAPAAGPNSAPVNPVWENPFSETAKNLVRRAGIDLDDLIARRLREDDGWKDDKRQFENMTPAELSERLAGVQRILQLADDQERGAAGLLAAGLQRVREQMRSNGEFAPNDEEFLRTLANDFAERAYRRLEVQRRKEMLDDMIARRQVAAPRPATRPRRSRTQRPRTPSAQPAPNVAAPDVEIAQNQKDFIRGRGFDIDAKLEERRLLDERDRGTDLRALRARLNGGQEGEAELDERIAVIRRRVESSRVLENERRALVEEIANRLVGTNRSLSPGEKSVIRNYVLYRANRLNAEKRLDAYQQIKDEYVAAGGTAGIPTAGRQRRAEIRRAQEAQRVINAPAPIPSKITTGQRERAEAVKGVLANGFARPRADRFVQNHGHRNVGGIEVPEPVPVGNANIRTPADAAAHLLNNGSLDEVPDRYLRDAIIANAAFPGESPTGKRFLFAGDPGDGINNRAQNVREDKTYVVKDTVSGKKYIMKTPSYVPHEAIGEMIAGAYGQAMGRQMARIRVAGDVRVVTGARGPKRNMPILIEHFGDIVDVDSIDAGGTPGGTPELEASRAQVRLLDLMMDNGDRHPGNFLWGNHGGVREMIPIDHGIFGSGQQVLPTLVERTFKSELRSAAAVNGGDAIVARIAALTPQQIDAIVTGTEAALMQAAKTPGDRTAIQRNMSILRTNMYNAKLWAEDVVANPRRRP